MAEERSLCRIDWKLGQALMPDHFLWQEDSLRHEWELRFSHQSRPMWGVVDLGWDELLLRTTGRLLIDRLHLVFETGLLVDVPGNARPVSLDLPKPGNDPIDLFLHLESEPEIVKSSWSDKEGSLVELRLQKLSLATTPLTTPLPGVHLLRLRPWSEGPPDGPARAPSGWALDPAYVPPLVNAFGLRDFGLRRFEVFNRSIERWKDMLRRRAVENALGVHKRVEASMYLRRAQSLCWFLRQVSPALAPADAPRRGPDQRQAPALLAHPFDLFERLVDLYLDVFAFRCGPLQTIQKAEPVPCIYQHEDLAGSFAAVEAALEEELNRPGAGSPEWAFARDPMDSDRVVCVFPEPVAADAELYFLVQFDADAGDGARGSGEGLDPRLLGLKLAAPERLQAVTRRVLPGIVFERVRLVPFPHDFDPTSVQFYRLKPGPEWAWAQAAGAIAYCPGTRGIRQSFVYSPDVRA
jgi:type VI secretion system protein ImpJ